jgi:peptidoglycan-N-acetylglucosamine deacetylase
MNILTFDIEEWFHILDNDSTRTEKEWLNFEYRLDSNMDRIFELLDRKNQNATFFCLGWVAREFPHILKKINSYGYEIATHSDKHQLAYEQNRNNFKKDLELSIKSIEDCTGIKVKSYRAPGFSVKEENKWVFEEIVNQGIENDCSIFPAKRSHGGFESYGEANPSILSINDLELKEFPINLYPILNRNLIFSGGGYFRLLPYPMIKYLMRRSKYVMTYFHPRDFDPNQPIIEELSKFRKFKSYYGLSNSFNKLEKLITDFEFIDLNTAIKSIDWENVPKIRI